ncbi:MAG: hypothetical protein QXD48_00285 [Candidatus Aenigmatarchaeota archaeon]
MIKMFKILNKKKKELKIDNAKKFLEEKTKRKISEIEKKIKLILDDLLKELSILKNLITQLKERNIEDNFANNIKNKYCERCLTYFNFNNPSFSYSELIKFTDNVDNILKVVENPSIKEFKQLAIFKNEMSKIASQSKILKRKINDFRKVISIPILERKEHAEKCIDWINEIQNKLNNIENEINDLINNEKKLFSEIIDLRKELENNRKKIEEKNIDELNKEIENLKRQRDAIKQQIDTEFGSILRPMKKLQHLAETKEINLSKNEKDVLNEYIISTETFLLSDKNNEIKKILERIKDYVNNGMISVDDKEKNKILMLYRSIDFFISIKEHYSSLVSQINEKENILNNIIIPYIEKRNKIENDITNKQKEIEKIKKILQGKNSEKERMKNNIKHNIEMLENIFRKLDNNIKIISNFE